LTEDPVEECKPIITAFLGTIEIIGMYIGSEKIKYPEGIDPCGPIDCAWILARKITNGMTDPEWDISPYQYAGPTGVDATWVLTHWDSQVYATGIVDRETGELIGLGNNEFYGEYDDYDDYEYVDKNLIFHSVYNYDGPMAIIIGTGLVDFANNDPYDYLWQPILESWDNDNVVCI
jgi:hypothetical protein